MTEKTPWDPAWDSPLYRRGRVHERQRQALLLEGLRARADRKGDARMAEFLATVLVLVRAPMVEELFEEEPEKT